MGKLTRLGSFRVCWLDIISSYELWSYKAQLNSVWTVLLSATCLKIAGWKTQKAATNEQTDFSCERIFYVKLWWLWNSLNILGQVDLGVTVLLFLLIRKEKCYQTTFITEIPEKTTPPLLNVVIEEIKSFQDKLFYEIWYRYEKISLFICFNLQS